MAARRTGPAHRRRRHHGLSCPDPVVCLRRWIAGVRPSGAGGSTASSIGPVVPNNRAGRNSWPARTFGWLWAGDSSEGLAGLVRGTPVIWLLGALIVVVWIASEVLPGRVAVRQALGSASFDVAKGQWWRLFTPVLLNTPDTSGRFQVSALD